MFMHVLYFTTFTEADTAENWIRANIEIESSCTHDYEPYMCKFYTSVALTERQQQIIADTVKPRSCLINEEL